MTRTSAAAQFILTMKPGGGVANTAVPTHDGTAPVIGTQITGTAGTWTGSPTLTYQWYKSLTSTFTVETAVSGATSINYTPLATDNVFGYYLRLAEIPNGVTAAAAYSAATGVVTLTGLSLWLDASDATTLFQDSAGTTPATANNDVIGRWADKSGNARHAKQGTTSNKPLLKTANQNGLNAVYFGGDDHLPLDAVLDLGNPSIFVVCKLDSAGTNKSLLEFKQGTALVEWLPTGGEFVLFVDSAVRATFITDTTPTLISAVARAANDIDFTKNGAAVVNRTTGASYQNRGASQVGANAGAGTFFLGHMYELICWNVAVTSDQRTAIKGYLNAKWAVY